MLVFDRHKANPPQLLSRNQSAPFAGFRAYNSARPSPGLAQQSSAAFLDGYHGLSGLGLSTESLIMKANEFNPEPITRTAIQVIDSISRFFGIGSGRKEADEIVPYQNRIHYEVLAPIAEAVNADYAPYLCQPQLQAMLDALIATEEWWLQFLHNTQWSDGRAAVQAEETLEFLFYDQERKLRELLTNAPWLCTVEAPDVIPVGGGATTPGSPRYTGNGGSTAIVRESGFTFTSALPWVLGGVFLLPKLFKR